MSLLAWIKKEWRAHRRWKPAYYRGYGILGTLLFSYKGMSREEFAREYRHMERLYRLMNGRVEALEFIARASDSYIGIPLKNLHIRKNALVAVIARQGKVIVPFGDDKIEEGDHVVIIVCENGIGDLIAYFVGMTFRHRFRCKEP